MRIQVELDESAERLLEKFLEKVPDLEYGVRAWTARSGHPRSVTESLLAAVKDFLPLFLPAATAAPARSLAELKSEEMLVLVKATMAELQKRGMLSSAPVSVQEWSRLQADIERLAREMGSSSP